MSRGLNQILRPAFLAILVLASLSSIQSAPANATCNGQRPTIISTGGNVIGTPYADVILVTGTNSAIVNAGGGNDSICTSTGNDVIDAGSGDDTILSGSGVDTINGGEGNDKLNAGDGNDRILGSNGNDTLQGGNGDDILQGGTGTDRIEPGAGSNLCAPDRADPIVGSCTIDANAPAISNTSVVAAGSILTFTWTISDLSGVADARVSIGGPSGWVTTWCGFGVPGRLTSQSGNVFTFSATCQVPSTAVNTTYTAFFAGVDAFGTRSERQVDFRITGGIADAVAPIFSEVSVPGDPFTTRQQVVITWRATDESGVEYSLPWVALENGGFANNSGRAYFEMGTQSRISGDAKNGVYQQILIPTEVVRSGKYSVWISSRDIYGNKDFIQSNVTFTYP